MIWIPQTPINTIKFYLMQLWVYMSIRFPHLSECLRQIPFLESMSLHYVLSELVLIKKNKTKVFRTQRVVGLKQIIQTEQNIVKIPSNKENL